jgi:hypothetical protein
MKRIGVLLAGLGMGIAGLVYAADTQPASEPALPACCGTACRNMSATCCTADGTGAVSCSMGGSCCLAPATKPAATNPAGGMGGMNMGK